MVNPKVVLDVSVRGQKGLGRYLDMISDGLRISSYDVIEFGKMRNPFSIMSFFRIPPFKRHCVYIYPHVNVPIVMLFSKSKIILCIHDVIPFYRSHIKTLIWKQFIHLLTSKNNVAIVCPSYYSLQKSREFFGFVSNKGTVIHNRYTTPIAHKRDMTISISQHLSCIYIGNNLPHKNVQVLIDAINLIYSDKSNDKLVTLKLFLGSEVKQKVALNIPKSVLRYITIYPQISDSELAAYMHQSHVLVQPSLHEGFGIPILEALGSGLKCIASDIPVFRELFEDCVLYFNPNDPSQLAKMLLNINSISNPNTNKIELLLERYSFANTSLKFASLIQGNDTTT